MIKRVGKRGDTLIEVMLAVGIFSMVAVAVVAVMSGGTSSAQTALETTLAREEIDSQAEALRFIHSAYIADKNSGTESRFGALWNTIKENAVVFEDDGTEEYEEYKESVAQYAPSSCQELYESGDNNIFAQNAFVLNTQILGTFDTDNIDNVIASGNSKLIPSTTYPRLVYEDSENDTLVQSGIHTELYAAEGIYIIAIKDPESTIIIDSEEREAGKKAAYYDFYIRTCWYGTGDQNPSTISTVMRLYDPDAVKEINIKPTQPDTPATPDTPVTPSTPIVSNQDPFATIGSVTFRKTNNSPAIVGIICYNSSSIINGKRAFLVGPILVSLDPAGANYSVEGGSLLSYPPEDINKTYTYKDTTFYARIPRHSHMLVSSCNSYNIQRYGYSYNTYTYYDATVNSALISTMQKLINAYGDKLKQN